MLPEFGTEMVLIQNDDEFLDEGSKFDEEESDHITAPPRPCGKKYKQLSTANEQNAFALSYCYNIPGEDCVGRRDKAAAPCRGNIERSWVCLDIPPFVFVWQ